MAETRTDREVISELEAELERVTAERDDYKQKFLDITMRITPKGSNVPLAERRRRRAKGKAARAARRLNRG